MQGHVEDQRTASEERSEPSPEATRRADNGPADPRADIDPYASEAEQSADAPQVLWDTPVQFLMMVATFGGLGLSLWAVLVVRGTLKAAVAANQGFKESAERQLRAYVVGDHTCVRQTFSAKSPERFWLTTSIRLKNTGQTPAFDMANIMRVDWVTEEQFEKWDIKAEPTSRAVLGPQAEAFARNDFQGAIFERKLVEAMVENGRTLWLRGFATYRDIGGRLWRHDYSWRLLDPKKLLAPPDAKGGKWVRRRFGFYANGTGNTLRMIEDPSEKK